MALKIWLPLDGDLRNLGCSPITIFSYNNFTVQTDGKIGKCYSGQGIYHLENEILDNTWSLCAWVKSGGWSQYNDIILCKNTSSSNNCQFYFSIVNGATLNLGINGGSGTVAYNYTFSTEIWYHIAATFDGSKYALYINGEQKQSGAVNTTLKTGMNNLGINCRSTNANGTGTTGDGGKKLNDVRIYDHCLSAAEVHEIAQGLVLHYKLDGNGFIDNIIPGTDNWLSWYKGSRWAASGNVLTYSAGSVSWVDADSPCIPWTDVENKTLTVSVDLRSDDFNYSSGSGFSLCFVRKASGPTATSYSSRRRECTPIHKTAGTVSTNWTTYSYTYTNFTDANFFNTYNGGGGDWFGLYLWNYTDKSIQVRNIKVEISNKPTPWCPNAADALYSTLGLGEAIVKDSSGYGHNGTITGNITTNSSTPRYNTSTNFPDSACSIGIGNLSTLIPEGIFTFNIWFKKVTDEWSSKAYETIFGGPSGFELEAKASSTNSPILTYYSWGGATTNYTLDEWHMITMIRTTTDTKFYLDGKLKLVGSAGSIPSGDYFIGAWETATKQNYRGYLSDARIYCTPLLDNDIKLLYNMGMRVDNLGGVHTFEVNENSSKNKLTKTGILNNNIIEPYLTLPDGSNWKLILYHYVDNGNNLFTSSNATYCNDFGLYSRLKDINNYTYNGKYEFYVNQDGKEFRWTQTSQPTASSIAGLATVEGYNNPVNGLAKANQSNTYIGYNAWWGACGCWTSYSTGGKTGIPGFGSHNGDGICEKYLALYARIEKNNASFENSSSNSTEFIEI